MSKKKSGLSDSPFFQRQSPPSSTPMAAPSQAIVQNHTADRSDDGNTRTAVRVYDHTAQNKRITKRHPFEIYEDQLGALKTLKARSMLAGAERSMSEMVREALDDYLDRQE